MRAISSLAVFLFFFSFWTLVHAETLATNLFSGSSGAQVLVLQRILNQDPDTRIAATGQGSPGNETGYFGPLTTSAVIRFQEKYAAEVLAPAGVARGSGYVGVYTRAKLNTLVGNKTASAPVTKAPTTAPIIQAATTTPINYAVTDKEKIDIYAGDKMLTAVQEKLLAAINAGIASQSSSPITMPAIAAADAPSVSIKKIFPQSGASGTRVTIAGNTILSNSTVRFGSNYIVRSLDRDLSGDYSFLIPSIPPGRYDLAVETSGAVSSTLPFVITDPKNPPVHLESITPASVSYGGTLTIAGSGFSPTGNLIITNYERFTDVPSPDGRTLTVTFAPERLRESVKVGKGTRTLTMYLSVVNNYGFSDSKKYFTMTI